MRKALITGITGQGGSYLTELLLSKGYEVHGIIRRSSSFNTGRIDHLYQDNSILGKTLFLHYGDLCDCSQLARLLSSIQPNELYNLGAMSHVKVSFEIPEYTSDVAGLGVIRLLECIREIIPTCKVVQASSSEMFGSSQPLQNENTPFIPQSPYAVAKLMGYWNAKIYRDAYHLFVCNAIMFNNESPRRGETFVTRKITRALARIVAGKQKKLILGNIDSKRDWGYSPEYMESLWLMLQQDKPNDYVIATGETHSVKDFLYEAFSLAGLNWRDHVETSSLYFRPLEVESLCGDASKAKNILGWKPTTTFRQLVKIMVDNDLKAEGIVT